MDQGVPILIYHNRKGIGTAVISLILQFAFNELNLHRVFLQVFSFNERAIKLYEKMGFIQEGKLRQALYRGGKWHDIIIMSILKNEYRPDMFLP